MATYNRGEPQSGQAFRDSRPLIANNFDAADDAISNDHVSFTDSTPLNRALHKLVTFNQVQGADPTPTYPQSVVYTKSRTVGGDTMQEPFFARKPLTGATQVVPIAPLAFVKFVGATGVISKQYNVTSVSRAGTGSYTINFTQDLPDSDYIFLGNGNVAAFEVNVNFRSPSTSSIQVVTVRISNDTVADPDTVSCFFWGF